jgi:NitT/TauT family transport system ATP-binding protein
VVRIDGIGKSFKEGKTFKEGETFHGSIVFTDFSLELNEGTITGLLGPSGCGKTTLCNIISGLVEKDSGSITGVGEVSYLFQEPRLLPWLSVWNNLELILKKHYQEKQRQLLITKILELTDLTDYAGYYPSQLSGGMARRISLARAFIYPANLVLMDEPFQAIDLKRKLELMKYVNRIWETTKKTALFVTHDISEAILLSDKIVVLSDKPASIKSIIINNIPRNERNLKNNKLLDLEKILYPLLAE